MFSRFYIPDLCYILPIWLGYSSSHSFTGSINSASCVLILSCLKSRLSIYTILFIRSITPTPSSLSLSLKRSPIFKSLTRGVLYITGSYKCLWTEACRLLLYKDTKLRRRRRRRQRPLGVNANTRGRQGASGKRAEVRVSRIWQNLAGNAP